MGGTSTSSCDTLFEHFVVCGLSPQALYTVQHEAGFVRSSAKYKPSLLDHLPHGEDSKRGPPPQLATCCLPSGVDIILKANASFTQQAPRTYAVVLTEGDGTKVYATCLSFYDEVPHELCAKHEELCGARALKCLCLLSHQPYLVTSDKVLRELYSICFVRGSAVPFADVVDQLLQVPCPQPYGPKVTFTIGGTLFTALPPATVGPPPGELSLQPLVEALGPDNLLLLFTAVLLERRVLLRAQQAWLMTVAAEGVVRLLHPLRFQHVYIPVMPYSLVDYLEAPTPFLMGLHSADELEGRVLDELVVVDLDTRKVTGVEGLKRCLTHPYLMRLRYRLRFLLQPSLAAADLVGDPSDTLAASARSMAGCGWGPRKEALMLRIFQDFFREVLHSFHLFVVQGSASPGVAGQLPPRTSVEAARRSHSGALAFAGTRHSLSGIASSSQGSNSSSNWQLHVKEEQLLAHHAAINKHADPALLQQLLQSLAFFSFAEDMMQQREPNAWLAAADAALAAMEARQPQQEGQGWQQQGWQQQEEEEEDEDEDGPDEILVPALNPGLLVPPVGCVHRTLPPLLVCEDGEGGGLRLRRKSTSGRRKDGAGRKRRAMSQMMGGAMDLRRKSPVITADDAPVVSPRLSSSSFVHQQSLLHRDSHHTDHHHLDLARISNTSNSSSSLSAEYGAEADLVRRQMAAVLQLLGQQASGGGRSQQQQQQQQQQQAPIQQPTHPQQQQPAAASTQQGASPAKGLAQKSQAKLTAPSQTQQVQQTQQQGKQAKQPQPQQQQQQQQPLPKPVQLQQLGQGKQGVSPEPSGSLVPHLMSVGQLEAAKELLHIQMGGNGWFLASRLKEELLGGVTNSICGSNVSSGSAASAAAAAGHKGPAASSPAPSVLLPACRERCLTPGAFAVLVDMFDAMLGAAAGQEDFRVVHAALQLGMCITCKPGHGIKQRLISSLPSHPFFFCEWFWAGAFFYAVSSSYLAAAEHAAIEHVVAARLADFAHYVTAVGITGNAAWQLLLRLGCQHPTHPISPDAPALLPLRAHLAHIDNLATHERHGTYGPMPPTTHSTVASSASAAGHGTCSRMSSVHLDAVAAGRTATAMQGAPACALQRDGGWQVPTASAVTRVAELERAPATPAAAAAAAAGTSPRCWDMDARSSARSNSARSISPRGISPRSSSPAAAAAAAALAGRSSKSRTLLRSAAQANSTHSLQHTHATSHTQSLHGLQGLHHASALQHSDSFTSERNTAPFMLAKPGGLQWDATSHSRAVTAAAASSYVAITASLDGTVRVFDAKEGQLRPFACMQSPAAGRGVAKLAMWRDGSRAALGNADGCETWVLDVEGGAAAIELLGHTAPVTALQVPQGAGNRLLTAAADGRACLWDLRYPSGPSATMQARSAGLLSIAVRHDGVFVAAGDKDCRVHVWDLRKLSTPLATCSGHEGWPTNLKFAPQGATFAPASSTTTATTTAANPLLVSGAADWTSRVWDASSGACQAVCVGHAGAVTALEVLVAGSGRQGGALRVVAGAEDGGVGVWQQGGELVHIRQAHWAPVRLVAQGDGTLLTASSDKLCNLWSLEDLLKPASAAGEPWQLLASQERRALVTSMAFDPVAELLYSGHRDGVVAAWNCSCPTVQGCAGAAA